MSFQNIAVIGAGTMGAGIAGQIANAGQKVMLFDISKQATDSALERLQKNEPAPLHERSCIKLIEACTIKEDFHKLAQCDWIIEAVVERLDIKRDLYRRLDGIIRDDCVVSSNTSSIPIRLLVDEMPKPFRARFAITHYFNPVRYMRLLELVRGTDTRPDVMQRLAAFNDNILGKGVVTCKDTPGFLGNRVGVYALQVALDEAIRHGIKIEHADALIGRPMGIPKTGVFGLYDLIGIDLMADVVDTLGDILPENDPFHAVGRTHNRAAALISDLIAQGFTGDKSGKGGFYRENQTQVMGYDGNLRARDTSLPDKAQAAANAQQKGQETLPLMINGNDAHSQFCRHFLGRVLGYAAALIPQVTSNPQDIDDAMKMGFNWIRGPFEMIDALGAAQVIKLVNEIGADVPMALQESQKQGPFYSVQDGALCVRRFEEGRRPQTLHPVTLPEGTQRFSLMRRTMTPLQTNASASLWALPDDVRLIEFHSKANALKGDSMAIVAAAACDHGRGIIVHNDAQHFSAGVDLNRFADFIERKAWDEMDAFLHDFQQAVAALKYCPVPVIGAPSGLALGGGLEVLLHCDKLVLHANSVLGLVEAGVGLLPSGGGIKTTYERYLNTTQKPEEAAWQAWMQIGYGKTGESPQQAAPLLYFLQGRDDFVMNRDKLISRATQMIEEMAKNYTPPQPQSYTLPTRAILDKMNDFMDNGIAKGWFKPHNKTTAMQIASVLVSNTAESGASVSEQNLFDRERAAFLRLAQTPQTAQWISAMLSGQPIGE